MAETHPIDALVDESLGALDDANEHRDALLVQRLMHEQAQRGGPAGVRPARRPQLVRRRLRIGLAAACAGAAVVIAVIALGPGESGSGPRPLPTLDAAHAALLDAGDAAGRDAWRPLGPGDLFHVATTTFTPDVPGAGGAQESMFLGGVYAGESWLGRDGRGKVVSIDGGTGDPSVYPSISRDRRTGKITGYGSRGTPPGAKVDVRAALAYPNSVNVMAWPRGGVEPYQRAWVRTRNGFVKTDDMVMTARTMGRAQTPANTMRDAWGASIEAIDAANAADDADAAARSLIDRYVDDPKRPPGLGTGGSANGEKPVEVPGEQLDREAGIEHAVQLLGTAPLSPDVRRALYRWLARQPGASIRRDATDELGRSGTEVTFEAVRKDEIPAYTVTAAEVLAPFVGGPQPIEGIEEIDRDTVYTVKDNVQLRRWRVSFIVDVETGELLQQYQYFRQGRVGKRPVFTTWASGPRIDVRDPGGGSGAGGGLVFTARDRSTSIEPTSAVCRAQPKVCA